MDDSTIYALMEIFLIPVAIAYLVLRIRGHCETIRRADILEKKIERYRKRNIKLLCETGMDKQSAVKAEEVLYQVGLLDCIEIKKLGKQYEYSASEGKGYFLMKGEEVDKVVLGNVVLFENGKRLHSPKVDEE